MIRCIVCADKPAVALGAVDGSHAQHVVFCGQECATVYALKSYQRGSVRWCRVCLRWTEGDTGLCLECHARGMAALHGSTDRNGCCGDQTPRDFGG